MGNRKHVTPADLGAAYEDQKRRMPFVSEAAALAAAEVVLPGLSLRGWSGWLCHVCRRVPLASQPPWSWFGCPFCRQVDARAASALGGRRLLPLGQHSIMNGASIPLSMLAGPGRDATIDQLVSIGLGWKQLGEWCDAEGARLVREAGQRERTLPDAVPVPQWQEWFPPGLAASADAFARLIAEQQPWLIDIEPRLGDVEWLAEGTR
jgi:hypothetical protein